MTDKEILEAVKAEIERLHEEHRGSKGDWYYRKALRAVLYLIDSMQEEPKFKTGDRIKPIDSCLGSPRIIEEVCDSWYVTDQGTLDFEYEDNWEAVEEPVSRTPADIKAAMQEVKEKSMAFTEAHQGEDADTILAQMRGEEPVSEDLEEAANFYADTHTEWFDADNNPHVSPAFKAGAKWQKEHLWKPADGDDLPEIDREVIALLDNDKVVFAHRPPEYWDGKNIDTGKVTRYYPKTYDKGGWNIPNVKYWLDVDLPKLED